MNAGRICTRAVATASAWETVRAAAQRMASNNVGTVVVLEPEVGGRPVGMLTDRDVAVRCVAGGKDPDTTKIESIMSLPVQTVEEHVPLEEAVSKMSRAGTRRLVVTGDDGRMVGLLSLDDVLDALAEETGEIGRLLSKQQAQLT